jgi:3-deoxy-D-manno-octulosonic-acid transferase
MNKFYQILAGVLAVLLFPLLILLPRFRNKLSERYGFWKLPPGEYIWFHGASVGEINGLISLIEQLKKTNPDIRILGSATSEKGCALLEKHVTAARLLPIDSFLFINKALKNVKILKFIFGETEIWPGLLEILNEKEVPCIMMNARLSEINFNTYKKLGRFISSALSNVCRFYAIDEDNAERLLKLGVPAERITVYGNLKYDRAPKITSIKEAAKLKQQIFSDNMKVIVLGNIRPGEEAFWSAIINKYHSRFKFVIAPRHSEKYNYFADWLKNCNISYDRLSNIKAPTEHQVLLLDVFGRLEEFYSFATLTFTGGSLIPDLGGHSPMEAASYGNCLLIGPHFVNQRDCVNALSDSQAINIVRNESDIENIMKKLSHSDPQLLQSGEKAKKVWEGFQGLSNKVFMEIFND